MIWNLYFVSNFNPHFVTNIWKTIVYENISVLKKLAFRIITIIIINFFFQMTGFSMGRLRFHHQLDSSSRVCLNPDEPLLRPHLRGLQHLLHPRTSLLDANSLRRVSAPSDFGAHGICRLYFWTTVKSCSLQQLKIIFCQ